jgi:probable rRNA maturation factor
MPEASVQVHVAEDLRLPLDPRAIEDAVLTVLEREAPGPAELSIAFVRDAEIERLNLDYLSHEGPTDVISFPLSRPGEPVVGDVYVGAEQARRQAEELGVPLAEELLRLAVHGTLHVLGYDHPEGIDRDGSEMYVRQEALLSDILGGGAGAAG